MAILRIRDNNGVITDIPAIKGDKGEKGDAAVTDQTYSPTSENAQSGKAVKEALNYYLDQVDNAIGASIYSSTDKEYSPTSQNAQSGVAVAQAIASIPSGGTWGKIVDITTTEELNSIVATADEFPSLAKCNEFLVRVIFQKCEGTTNLQLGSSRLMINEILSCQITNTNVSYAATSEFKAHIQLIDDLVHSVCTDSLVGHTALMGATRTNVGNRFINSAVSNLKYYLSNNTSLIPVGTQLVVYGKVEG